MSLAKPGAVTRSEKKPSIHTVLPKRLGTHKHLSLSQILQQRCLQLQRQILAVVGSPPCAVVVLNLVEGWRVAPRLRSMLELGQPCCRYLRYHCFLVLLLPENILDNSEVTRQETRLSVQSCNGECGKPRSGAQERFVVSVALKGQSQELMGICHSEELADWLASGRFST